MERFFIEIVVKLRKEKFYLEEILAAASSVMPNKASLVFISGVFSKFCRKQNQDALLATFYQEGKINGSFFASCKDQKAVDFVLIPLLQKLVDYYKQASSDITVEKVDMLYARLYNCLKFVPMSQ